MVIFAAYTNLQYHDLYMPLSLNIFMNYLKTFGNNLKIIWNILKIIFLTLVFEKYYSFFKKILHISFSQCRRMNQLTQEKYNSRHTEIKYLNNIQELIYITHVIYINQILKLIF